MERYIHRGYDTVMTAIVVSRSDGRRQNNVLFAYHLYNYFRIRYNAVVRLELIRIMRTVI